MYLSPYSPDLNPIEEAFAKLSQGAAAEGWGAYAHESLVVEAKG